MKSPPLVSIIIPAYREAERIAVTLSAARRAADDLDVPVEIIVVDDGSDDDTAARATEADRVIRLPVNQGKGAALQRGLMEGQGQWLVMLDADLEESAAQFPLLLAPVRSGEADMTIALFNGSPAGTQAAGAPPGANNTQLRSAPRHSERQGGFGLALQTARWGVARLTGRVLQAPLSGQRALRREHLPRLLPLEPGFGLEVGLDIDALRARLRVLEVPTRMRHAGTGRDWAGFRHRGRQLLHIVRALGRRALPFFPGRPRFAAGRPRIDPAAGRD